MELNFPIPFSRYTFINVHFDCLGSISACIDSYLRKYTCTLYIYIDIHIYTKNQDFISNMMMVATLPTAKDPYQSHDIFYQKQPAISSKPTSSRCHLSVTLPSLHHAYWKWNALKGTLTVWYRPLGSDNTSSPPKIGVPECPLPQKKWLNKNLIQLSAFLAPGLFQERTSLILRHRCYCLGCLDAFFCPNEKMAIHTNICKPEVERLEMFWQQTGSTQAK